MTITDLSIPSGTDLADESVCKKTVSQIDMLANYLLTVHHDKISEGGAVENAIRLIDMYVPKA